MLATLSHLLQADLYYGSNLDTVIHMQCNTAVHAVHALHAVLLSLLPGSGKLMVVLYKHPNPSMVATLSLAVWSAETSQPPDFWQMAAPATLGAIKISSLQQQLQLPHLLLRAQLCWSIVLNAGSDITEDSRVAQQILQEKVQQLLHTADLVACPEGTCVCVQQPARPCTSICKWCQACMAGTDQSPVSKVPQDAHIPHTHRV